MRQRVLCSDRHHGRADLSSKRSKRSSSLGKNETHLETLIVPGGAAIIQPKRKAASHRGGNKKVSITKKKKEIKE